MDTVLRLVLGILGLAALIFVGLLVFGTVTDYNPPPVEDAEAHPLAVSPAVTDSTLTFLIWNIGYSGLGRDQDFFMDGGKNVQPRRSESDANFAGALNYLRSQQDIDFLLLQEVDRDAKRSFGRDQAVELSEALQAHHWYFAANFKVKFIPVPFDPFPFVRPIGRVHGGLVTFSKPTPTSAKRYDYPGNYGWPTRIFHLDRCFLETRYPLAGGKELVVINSHNSAYDEGGVLKAQEMAMLKDYVLGEFNQGNYVIAGGDWNQCPPDFDPKTFKKDEAEYDQQNIPADYLPGWTWAYDGSTPTNRKVARPYDPASTFTTVIDFYLLSPNVDLLSVQGVSLDFAHSDHQPVQLKVQLR
ncbi:MAG: endonuclease/exonuclease/phosphatase family protein [Bacteroidetes bacterium]|nr:endonuclease/exonuclease/phosphatase family protein [Bacteroidota bacterium]